MGKVPGTYQGKPPLARRLHEPEHEAQLLALGALLVQHWVFGDARLIASREPCPRGGYWWHLSLSCADRLPTWDEIKAAVYWPGVAWAPMPGKAYAQLLGPVDASRPWVNVHEHTLHLYEIDDPMLRG